MSAPATQTSPRELAALFAQLADELIPGDASWPSAASIGVQGIMLLRFVEENGEKEVMRLATALLAAGAPFTGKSEAERRAVVETLVRNEPDLFDRLRAAAVFAYYESPIVAEAIRQSGRPYQMSPHKSGYPRQRFDIERDKPKHARGAYVPTSQVRRIDISSLDLGTSRTQNWGLKR
ncbi:MAG: hypothetical protein ACOZAM_22445 [Pseudomonadota bacterium]